MRRLGHFSSHLFGGAVWERALARSLPPASTHPTLHPSEVPLISQRGRQGGPRRSTSLRFFSFFFSLPALGAFAASSVCTCGRTVGAVFQGVFFKFTGDTDKTKTRTTHRTDETSMDGGRNKNTNTHTHTEAQRRRRQQTRGMWTKKTRQDRRQDKGSERSRQRGSWE